jgi:predicted amidohydrolase
MRLGLLVNRVGVDRARNLAEMLMLVKDAAEQGADLVLFGETAVTGLITTDEPATDLAAGVSVPGTETDALAKVARTRRLWLGLGILERDGDALYDTAVLFNPLGQIVLKYRRVDPHWHGPHADPAVYRQGQDFPVALTPGGRTMFLLCGDLWDDDIVARVREKKPDLLLYPFARSFGPEIDQARWDREEMDDYAKRIQAIGAPAAMVNYLADPDLAGWSAGCFGGAWMVLASGRVTEALLLGRPGVLLVDL